MFKIIAANNPDHEMLEGLSRSESNAVRKVYDLVLPSVIAWVQENNGSEDDARDLFQEALIALFLKLENGDFILTCTLKSFLRIVCRNLWLTRLRDSKNHQTSALDGIEVEAEENDLPEQIAQTDRNRLFITHFNKLSENCRKLLGMFFNKIPFAEIALRLNTSEGYIKKAKFKCKERLISAIQDDPLFEELNNAE
ncbi:MAG: sigma-70 family RNA polymerase sigma factor [Bacteroidales bacterium]|nr:sigma-70 family RNA polymerase sigma factor [Bacteroidales bacterium]